MHAVREIRKKEDTWGGGHPLELIRMASSRDRGWKESGMGKKDREEN